jgi:hypothetical protein
MEDCLGTTGKNILRTVFSRAYYIPGLALSARNTLGCETATLPRKTSHSERHRKSMYLWYADGHNHPNTHGVRRAERSSSLKAVVFVLVGMGLKDGWDSGGSFQGSRLPHSSEKGMLGQGVVVKSWCLEIRSCSITYSFSEFLNL